MSTPFRLSSRVLSPRTTTHRPRSSLLSSTSQRGTAPPTVSSSSPAPASFEPRRTLDGVSFEEVCGGLSDWRNIQEIVRSSMRSLFEIIKTQDQQISELQRICSSQASGTQEEMRHFLERTEEKIERIHHELDGKASLSDLARVSEEVSSSSATQDIIELLEQKADDSRMEEFSRQWSKELDEYRQDMRRDFDALRSQPATLTADIERVHARLGELSKWLDTKADTADVRRLEERKADQEDVKVYVDDAVGAVQRHVDQCSSIQYVDERLRSKADVVSLDSVAGAIRRIDDVQKSIMDIRNDVLSIQQSIREKADTSSLRTVEGTLLEEIRRKVDIRQHQASEAQLKEKLEQKADIDSLRHESDLLVESIRKKADDYDVGERFAGLSDALSKLRGDLEEKIRKEGTTQHAFMETRASIEDVSSMERVLDRVLSKLDGLEKELKEEEKIVDQCARREDVSQQLGEKMDSSVAHESFVSKRSGHEMFKTLQTLVPREEVQMSLERIDAAIQELRHGIHLRMDAEDAEKKMEALRRDLLTKADVRDMCKLLDSKADVEEVNKSFGAVAKEIEESGRADDLKKALTEQAVINDMVCSQLVLGRWVWKSQKLKGGNGVPWNVQVINTNPDNFIWSLNKVHIICVAPGLYEVSFGFFCRKKPTIQLHVNGEPVLSAVNSSSYVVHHSSGRLTGVGRHSSGNITGLTLLDFVALPERAKIALSFTGDLSSHVEGFLNIRKL
eukprot:TRINITY_DN1974_c0_g2_i1.p1 TRINITY_DN1974_c0_g2~~TRINITY_DN1974_c0_g2_i1.p1  ORF type:complete len:734 (-),score=237.83 TRINITY_DN1974_c0_g2_i1:63-2264(-)